MVDFEPTRAALAKANADRARNAEALLLARESVHRGKSGASRKAAKLEAEGSRLAATVDAAWRAFEVFSDPKKALRHLTDRNPILLFPLRIETRFKRNAQGIAQLWVRVYPDQCLAESFEQSLTEQETRNAETFWAAIWRAGGVEAEERAAWRELATAHGAGRAAWIVKHHSPTNTADKPLRTSATDVLLVATADVAPPAQASAFWQKVWRAGGNAAALAAERGLLELQVDARTAQLIVETFAPINLGQSPADGVTRANTTVVYAVARFTPLEALALRRNTWSRAPQVQLLPERLVLMAWRGDKLTHQVLGNPIRAPLAVGPDPNATGAEQLKPQEHDLHIPDSIKWMFDFERALELGMAFRVPLTPDEASSGFDRIVVLGVRVSDSAAEGAERLEALIQNHLYSRTGFELLPQGTPTNNTESASTGFNVHGNPDDSFDTAFLGQPAYTAEADSLLRSDGEWFSRLLGISQATGQQLPNAGGRDQLDARAMHLALWPGTAGYMMRTMLEPVFSEETVDATRIFFTRYVSGRGPIPALRIGAQPYGVLPVTSFREIKWFEARAGLPVVGHRPLGTNFLARLHALLVRIQDDWSKASAKASFVGKRGSADPHQVLLDVLGLHAGSVEFHSVKTDSETARFHLLSLMNHPLAVSLLREISTKAEGRALLRRLGYSGEQAPAAFKMIFSDVPRLLDGPLIDDSPFSETAAVTNCAGAKNYLEWLSSGARANFDIIQEQRGFDTGKEPRALLYLQLRYALQKAFDRSGHGAKVDAGLLQAAQVSHAEPAFVHVQAASSTSESRYSVLHERIGNRRIADLVSVDIDRLDAEIGEQVTAIERLARRPTAALERAFTEHVDCLSYRLDAWKQGLLFWQLERLRAGEQKGIGTYLGAFGWLESVRPENKVFTPVALEPEVDVLVNKPGDPPLMRESTNLGLIHAPSINHATTAAVLLSGHHANAGRLAIDLSSRRVRLASGILEGIRAGQSLGALLGYRFERRLHDSGILALRGLVFAIRRQFPLAANQIKSTVDPALTKDQAEAIAARNVVDGRKLLLFVDASRTRKYPWDVAALPPAANAAQQDAIDEAVADLRDVNDALADLGLAEGVHQAVIGNFGRSASTLEAFAKGNLPPEADVARSPRSGTSLTLRNVIHLDPGATANPLGIAMTPMADAEPVLNHWLGARLPPADAVGCSVTFTDRATGGPHTIFVRQSDIGLQPLDLVLVTQSGSDPSLGFLDDRVLQFVHATEAPGLADPIAIDYTKRVAGMITFFELRALLTSLYAMLLASRPIKSADLIRQVDARAVDHSPSVLDTTRLETAHKQLNDTRIPALRDLLVALPAGTIDDAIAAYIAEVSKLALWRLPQTGIGFIYHWRARRYAALSKKLAVLLTRWDSLLTDAKQKLVDFDGAPALPETEQRVAIAAIELVVSTSYITPPPATVALHRTAAGAKVSAFGTELEALRGIATTRFQTYSAFLAALQVEALEGFEHDALTLADDAAEVKRFRSELVTTLEGLIADAQKRANDVAVLLATSPLTVESGQEAAKKLFGEDFQLIPTFTLSAKSAADFTAAQAYSASGDLTKYLVDTIKRDFPVDDWLHGVARVRPKMRHWENSLFLCEAFDTDAPIITPLQLPFEAGDCWCALDIPPAASEAERAIRRDKLLYNAHLPTGFDAAKPMCGLLIDEWNEVIPEKTETTGVAFHYDRPNSEPPQCWLLALPAVLTGTWSWEQLVAAVISTLDEAKRRTVEPDHLGTTDYSWFLPATYSAYTYPEISISNYLLRNVEVLTQLEDN